MHRNAFVCGNVVTLMKMSANTSAATETSIQQGDYTQYHIYYLRVFNAVVCYYVKAYDSISELSEAQAIINLN